MGYFGKYGEEMSNNPMHPVARVLIAVAGFILLLIVIAVLAGI